MKTTNFYILVSIFVLSLILGIGGLYYKGSKIQKPENSTTSFIKTFINKKINKGIFLLNIYSEISVSKQTGILGKLSGSDYWVEQINFAIKDKRVKGMIIRINSPGGTVGATQEVYNAVLRFKKTGRPVVVSTADLNASGAYYISTAADKIVVNEGSLIGSVGVIISSPNFSKLLKKWGIHFNTFKSGKYKDILSSVRPMDIKDKIMLQNLINSTYKQFLNAVIKGRSKKMKKSLIKKYADGRIFNGTQAVKIGFADSIGDFETTKKIIAKMVNIKYKDLQF